MKEKTDGMKEKTDGMKENIRNGGNYIEGICYIDRIYIIQKQQNENKREDGRQNAEQNT